MRDHFLGANPVLPANDVIETAAFFEEMLGFTIKVLWENPAYGVVRRGDAIIEFGEGRQQYAGSGICVIQVDNADAIHREWQSRDVEFVGDFAERDYGSKDFRIKDNNGNMLIVGHALKNQRTLLHKGNVA